MRRKCRCLDSSTERKNRFARSVRTRRSVRSRHVGLDIVGTGVRINEVVGKMLWVQCRADSVEHATSPSRRDASRQVVVSPVIPTSARCCRTRMCPAPLRRAPQSAQPARRFRVPRFCLGSRVSFPVGSECTPGEIWTQNSRSHIAMSYELSIAWKASQRAYRRRFARPLMVLNPRWSREPLNAASAI